MKTIKRLFLVAAFGLAVSSVHASTLHWVGGSGNWGDIAHWLEGSVPQTGDDVVIDNSSGLSSGGTITINTTAVMRHLTITLTTGVLTLAGSASNSLTILGDATFDDAMLITFSGTTFFKSSTTSSITMNGAGFEGPVTFDGIGTFTLADDFWADDVVTLTKGSLTIGVGNTMEMERFSCDNSNSRSINASGSIINITNGIDVNGIKAWDFDNTTGLTFTTNSSTELHFLASSTNPSIISSLSGGLIYQGLVHFHNAGYITAHIHGTNTFDHLIIEGSAEFRDDNEIDHLEIYGGNTYEITSGKTLDIITAWEVQHTTCIQHATLTATLLDDLTPATIDFAGSCTDLDLKYLIIEFVEFTGTTSCSTAYIDNIYNVTSMSGWTGVSSTITDMFWIGGDGDWSDCANWSSTSGGSPGSVLPGPYNDVHFDENSFSATGQVCTVDFNNAVCHDMIWTDVNLNNDQYEPELASLRAYNNLSIYGSLDLVGTGSTGMVFSIDGNIRFRGNTSETITSNGQTFNGDVYFEGQDGTWTLQDAFTSGTDVFLYAGTLNTGADEDVSLTRFWADVENPRGLVLNDSDVEVVNTWIIYPATMNGSSADASLSFNSGTSEITMLTGNFARSGDYGEDYYDLVLNNSGGTQALYGKNNTFNNVTFLGNGSLNAANHILNDLTFSPGKSYTISNTQTVDGSLDAIGTCTDYINISNGTFSFSGSQTVEYCVIQDNTATGTGTFTADQSALSGTTGWIGGVSGQPFHFKGILNNEWGDPDNWFTDDTYTTPIGCIPGPGDDVFFKDGSFAAQNDLSIDVLNAFCKDMTWSTTSSTQPAATETSTNNRLNIFGSLVFVDNTGMDWQFDGEIDFEAASGPENIDAADQVFLKELYFKGGATWTLDSDLETVLGSVGITINAGDIDVNANTLTLGHIWSTSSAVNGRSLDIDNAIVNLTTQTSGGVAYAWQTNANLALSTTGSQINIDNIAGTGVAHLRANGATFNNVRFVGQGTTGKIETYASPNVFNNVEFDGDGEIKCSNTFNDLVFHADIGTTPNFSPTYTLTSGTTQTILGELVSTGTSGYPIYIKSNSSGNAATIRKDNAPNVCLDWVVLEDMTAADGTLFPSPDPFPNVQFFAGLNSSPGTGNTGWTFAACIPLELTGCVGEPVEFNFLNNGSDFEWNFGDGTSPVNTMDAQTTHTYSSMGSNGGYYQVAVEVDWGTGTVETQYFDVQLTENCCHAEEDENYTNKSGTILLSETWPDKVFVSADVFVTTGVALDVTNSDVVFAPGTGIYFQDQSKLFATNSTFRPCAADDSWTGLDFSEESYGKLNENILINAETGAAIATDAVVKLSNNQFLNNQKGVFLGANGETSMAHVITGNTFLINSDNPFTDGSLPEDFFGVQVSGLQVEGVISQNDFTYSSSVSNIDRFYGIHNNAGELVASENNFTNVTFAYYQNGGVGTSAFENNEVDFNQSSIGLYSTPSEIVGVTIVGGSTPSLVANNQITMSYESSDNSTAIYNTGTGTVAHGNTISGFEYGVKWVDGDGEISENEISNSGTGIYLYEASETEVIGNEVKSSTDRGIALSESVTDISVRRNTVQNDPESSGTVGIEYIITISSAPSGVEFVDNCVYDTEHAMYFENQYTSCHGIPVITGNYLFNYTATGIYIDKFEGEIGDFGTTTPSRNSFVPNAGGSTPPWDVQETNTCSPTFIELYGYWPSTLNLSGPVIDKGTGADDNSYATCGNQTLKEDDLPAFPAYITTHYPFDYENNQYVLKADFTDVIGNIDPHERGRYAMAVYGILSTNNDLAQAGAFVTGLETQNTLTGNDLAWIKYRHEAREGNHGQAALHLNKITPINVDEEELLLMEKIRIGLAQNHLDLRSLSEQDNASLAAADNRGGEHAAMARDMIHVNKSGHPFIYEHGFNQRNPKAASGNTNKPAPGALLVYPNPAQGDFTVSFNVEALDNARLTITSILGVQMMNIAINNGNTRQIQLDASGLPSGLYMVSFYNNDELLDAVQLVKN